MAEHRDGSRTKQVLIGLGALVAVTALIGALVSVVALGLANVTGVTSGDSAEVVTTGEPTLFVPRPSPTEDSSTPFASPFPTETSTGPTEPTTTKSEPVRRITLSASPTSVAASEQINLDGTYPGGDGVTLQVQRFEGSWVDFPTTATVTGGTFSTFIFSGQTGRVRFRVIDEATGEESTPVTVTIG